VAEACLERGGNGEVFSFQRNRAGETEVDNPGGGGYADPPGFEIDKTCRASA
jgi:hypothetical protein